MTLCHFAVDLGLLLVPGLTTLLTETAVLLTVAAKQYVVQVSSDAGERSHWHT